MKALFQAHSSPVFPYISAEAPTFTEEDAKNCYTKSPQYRDIYFSDTNIQKYYEKFRIDSVTLWTIVPWLVLSVFLVANALGGIFVIINNYPSEILLQKCLIIARIIVCILIILNCGLIMKGVKKNSSQADLFSYISLVTNLTNTIMVASSFVNAVVLISRSLLGDCGEHDYDHIYYLDCNDSHEYGGMPQAPFLLLVMGNIFLVTTFKCHHYWAVLLSYFIVVVGCIASIAVSPNPVKSLVPGALTLFLFSFYRELETSTYFMFRTMLNLEANKRSQILEMKHFIGNVAHDLKTPLHGLAMSLDMILDDSVPQIQNENLRNDFVGSLEMCKTNCSFMTMAINRTQDFAKSASNKSKYSMRLSLQLLF
jgi:hypothetical protein